MSSLLVCAIYDTDDNGRHEFTQSCLKSLFKTVDLNKHRVVLVDNNSCEKTKNLLSFWQNHYSDLNERVIVITNSENLGTAKAVNKGLRLRHPGEYAIKLDNDVIWHQAGWVDEMETVMNRMPTIGILGLKRKDLLESPYAINTDQRSRLLEVPHQPGEKWYVVEDCKHVMGTCTMLSPALLDRVGYFYQMNGLYGFDDSLLCVRSTVAGFMNCFLHGIEIDHIDPGGTDYTKWKEKYAGEILSKYGQEEAAYKTGLKDVYYEDKK